jgi:hypothetical protein
VSAASLAADGAPVSAVPLAVAGVAALAAGGLPVSAALLAEAGVAAEVLAVEGVVFGAPFWAALRAGISLKNASHVADNSMR